MSNRKLTLLGLVAVAMVAWAVMQSKIANRPATPAHIPETLLIQGLNPAQIAAIIVGGGDDAVILNRRGNQFVVADKSDYPAQLSQINELITNVLDIKARELVTSNPENHDDLEVTEEKARSAVKFLDKDEKIITGVVIGKRDGSGGSYVRLTNSNDVYVADDTPWIHSSAMDYIEQQLLEVDKADIIRVTVADSNGSYTLKSEPNSTEVTLDNMPEGKQLKGTEHEQVFSALTSLRFNDVMEPSSAPNDLTFDRSYVCKLKDSTIYSLKIARSGSDTFVKAGAAFADTGEVVKKPEVESEEELKKKEAILLAREAAEKFNERHARWIYKIDEWKAKNLTKSLDSLLEDIPKPEPEQPQEVEDSNSATEAQPSTE